MISEASCDTEDWSDFFELNYILKCIMFLQCNVFDSINTALVSIKYQIEH